MSAETPIRGFVAQGWEVAHYSAGYDPTTGQVLHSFFLRRQSAAKIVTIRKKIMGEGLVIEEMEV